jgi:hypothetical protein
MEVEENVLSLRLMTNLRGVDQEEEIVFGTTGWSRKFVVPVRYVDATVLEQVTGLIQRIDQDLGRPENVDRISVFVRDPEGAEIGQLSVGWEVIGRIRGPKEAPIESVVPLYDVNTVRDAVMSVRRDGVASEV